MVDEEQSVDDMPQDQPVGAPAIQSEDLVEGNKTRVKDDEPSCDNMP